ncbi:hypothetical protein ABMY26_00140 (plasmid) [Azospirillum sp. HJ39]|uniref:hypothetical protein n=1 Tax=Azospirillum sp. HJ39 TaxID=3159496 RepID=UPI00355921E0
MIAILHPSIPAECVFANVATGKWHAKHPRTFAVLTDGPIGWLNQPLRREFDSWTDAESECLRLLAKQPALECPSCGSDDIERVQGGMCECCTCGHDFDPEHPDK